jgi:hypothetical protein
MQTVIKGEMSRFSIDLDIFLNTMFMQINAT